MDKTQIQTLFTLTTVDGATVQGYADSELDALDNASRWYPEDTFVNVVQTHMVIVNRDNL